MKRMKKWNRMPEQKGQAWAHVIKNNIAHSLFYNLCTLMQFTRRRKKKVSQVEIAYDLVRTLLMSNNFGIKI